MCFLSVFEAKEVYISISLFKLCRAFGEILNKKVLHIYLAEL